MDEGYKGFDWSELSSDRITRRNMLKLLAGSAAGLSVLSAFDAPPASSAATPCGHLICGWNFDAIKILDPAFMNIVEQMQVSSNMFSGLVRVDVGFVIKPELAEKWEVSKDGLTWTFQLRKGVVFHNGQKFNADDVEYTFKRTTDPKLASIHRSRLDIVEKFEKLGEYEVRFKLASPSVAFLMSTLTCVPARAMTIVCRTALEKMGKEAYNVMPVGTGPFRVAKHQIGSDIVLEKNPDYFVSGLPKLDKITIKMVPESATQVNALRAGAPLPGRARAGSRRGGSHRCALARVRFQNSATADPRRDGGDRRGLGTGIAGRPDGGGGRGGGAHGPRVPPLRFSQQRNQYPAG